MSYQHEPYYSKQLVCGLVSVKVTPYRKVIVVVPDGHYTDMHGAVALSLSIMPECSIVDVQWPDGTGVNVYVLRASGWKCVYMNK